MGVCGECSVLVDGVQRRACLEYAREGAEIFPMQPLAPARAGGEKPLFQERRAISTPDILIVGAGPAGLAGARLAASAGLKVLVVDERSQGGGQYFKQPGSGFHIDSHRIDSQFAKGACRITEAQAAGVRFLFEATVWSAFPPNELVVSDPTGTFEIKASRIILSPGAYERAHIFPGWTIPGVMTTGAAQTLLRGSQTAPGRRVLVAGNGPLNLQVASELVRSGVDVVALAELAPPPWKAPPLATLAMLWNAPGLVWEGARHLAALSSAGIPIYSSHVLVSAEGDEKVRRGTIARVDANGAVLAGSQKSFDVDSICMGYGFLAQNEMARALGCTHRLGETGGLVTERDRDGRTSVPEVFVAGDAASLGGAKIAEAQGMISGAAAAADLGFQVSRSAIYAAKRLLKRHGAFQNALWTVYRAPPPPDLTEANVLICRCEEVDLAGVGAALDEKLRGLGAIKRVSRLGMGRCQGRYCSVKLAELVERQCGEAIPTDDYFAPRSPFKPVTIGTVVDASEM